MRTPSTDGRSNGGCKPGPSQQAALLPSALKQLGLADGGNIEGKLGIAWTLVANLLPEHSLQQLSAAWPGMPNVAPLAQRPAALPLLVHAHYVQAVFEWAAATLIKSAQPASAPGNKAQKRRGATAAAPGAQDTSTPDTPPGCMDARLWWLAAQLLAAGASRVSPAVITAATMAVQPRPGAPIAAASLLQAVTQVLELAAAGGQGASADAGDVLWQPPLDGLAALLAALLACSQVSAAHSASQAQQAAGEPEWQAAWEAAVRCTLRQLLACVHKAQNPRRALAAILAPPALRSLLLLGFPVPSGAKAGGARKPEGQEAEAAREQAAGRLAGMARDTLLAAILHDAHVPGLLEACQRLAAPLLAAAHSVTFGAASGDSATPAQLPGQPVELDLGSLHSYHRTVFQAIESSLASSDATVCAATLRALLWLLQALGGAAVRHRKALTIEASGALRAALSRASKPTSGDTDAAAEALSHLLLVEFRALVVLCSLVVRCSAGGRAAAVDREAEEPQPKAKRHKPVRAARGSGMETAGSPDGKCVSSSFTAALADLLAAAKAMQAYQPTQDVSQQHRGFLTHLTQHVLLRALDQGSHKDPGASAAVCQAVCAVLQLEHRALTCDLPVLWDLLSDAALSHVATERASWCSGAANGQHLTDSLFRGEGGQGGLQPAVSCLQQLVGAHSELRQLGTLLTALLQRLSSPDEGSAQRSGMGAACFSLVVAHPGVVHAVEAAVRGAPSGQSAPLLVVLVEGLVPLLCVASVPGDSDALPTAHACMAATALAASVLDALGAELPSSVSVAAACTRGVELLSPALIALTSRACKPHALDGTRQGLQDLQTAQLTLALQAYSCLLRVHARCASLNPEIQPLPSQGVTKTVGSAEGAGHDGVDATAQGQMSPQGHDALGFFAPAAPHAEPEAVSKLLKRAAKGAPAGLNGADGVLVALAHAALRPALVNAMQTRDDPPHLSSVLRSALASVAHSCLLQRAATLRDQALEAQHRCTAGRAGQPRAAADTTALEAVLATATAVVSEDADRVGAATLSPHMGHWVLPAWLDLPAPPAAPRLSLAYLAVAQSVAERSPSATKAGDGGATLFTVGAPVYSIVWLNAWTGCVHAATSWGTHLPPATLRRLEAIMLAAAAAAGPTHAAQPRKLLDEVAQSATALLGSPEWQLLPAIRGHLLPAAVEVGSAFILDIASPSDGPPPMPVTDAVAGTRHGSHGAAAGVLQALCAALATHAAQQGPGADRKAAKALKLQASRWREGGEPDMATAAATASEDRASPTDDVARVERLIRHLQLCESALCLVAQPIEGLCRLQEHACLCVAITLHVAGRPFAPTGHTGSPVTHSLAAQPSGPSPGSPATRQLLGTCVHAALSLLRAVQLAAGAAAAARRSDEDAGVAVPSETDTHQPHAPFGLSLKRQLDWHLAAGAAVASVAEGSGADALSDLSPLAAALLQGALTLHLAHARHTVKSPSSDDGGRAAPGLPDVTLAVSLAGDLLSGLPDGLWDPTAGGKRRAQPSRGQRPAGGTSQAVALTPAIQAAALLSGAAEHMEHLRAGDLAGPGMTMRGRRRAGAHAAEACASPSAAALHAMGARLSGFVQAGLQADGGAASGSAPALISACLLSCAAVTTTLTAAGKAGWHDPTAGDAGASPCTTTPLLGAIQTALDAEAGGARSRHLVASQELQAACCAALGALAGALVVSEAGPSQEQQQQQSTLAVRKLAPVHLQLVDCHLKLLAACCPPSQCSSLGWGHNVRAGWWGFDVSPGAWPATARTLLLGSLRHMLQHSGARRAREALRHLTAGVLVWCQSGGPASPDLAALLLCLLVALELEAGPAVSQVLASEALRVAPLMVQTITCLLVPASNASSNGREVPAFFSSLVLALRCLESMAGRPVSFPLPDTAVSAMLSCAALPQQLPRVGGGPPVAGASTGACRQGDVAVVNAGAGLLVACLRHRAGIARSCAPLTVDALRALLRALVGWASVHVASNGDAQRGTAEGVDRLAACSAAITRVCECLVEDPEHLPALRLYCMHLLADYITHVAIALPHTSAEEAGTGAQVIQQGQGGLLPPAAAHVLRKGAVLLLGALTPRELQALHMALGHGWGGARRSALAALRKQWERDFKYTGKV